MGVIVVRGWELWVWERGVGYERGGIYDHMGVQVQPIKATGS